MPGSNISNAQFCSFFYAFAFKERTEENYRGVVESEGDQITG